MIDIFLIIDSLSVLTVLGQALILGVALVLILSRFGSKKAVSVQNWISHHGILLMFIVAITATSGSLFFSEIALFAPCKDCWIQRIFMYPQVILLAVALWRKDRNIVWYILPLAISG